LINIIFIDLLKKGYLIFTNPLDSVKKCASQIASEPFFRGKPYLTMS